MSRYEARARPSSAVPDGSIAAACSNAVRAARPSPARRAAAPADSSSSARAVIRRIIARCDL